jgi:hypothetical protein
MTCSAILPCGFAILCASNWVKDQNSSQLSFDYDGQVCPMDTPYSYLPKKGCVLHNEYKKLVKTNVKYEYLGIRDP